MAKRARKGKEVFHIKLSGKNEDFRHLEEEAD